MIIGFVTYIFTIEYPILLPRAGRYLGILVIPWYGWNQTIRVAIDLVAKFRLLKLRILSLSVFSVAVLPWHETLLRPGDKFTTEDKSLVFAKSNRWKYRNTLIEQSTHRLVQRLTRHFHPLYFVIPSTRTIYCISAIIFPKNSKRLEWAT